jgi:hypothetical protein
MAIRFRAKARAQSDRARSACSERGSALLIVFVFAAIVAITLYMEMPVAAFEAQRQKEQLLVDAGNEYAHAVKIFVRKVGRYPTSIKDLQDTNRMRFLRRELPDPFSGKADWRLLHAGPGGTIIDSKVTPPNPLGNTGQGGNGNAGSANGSGGSPGAPTSTTGFQNGGNSSTAFGASSSSTNSGFGSTFGGSSASTATNTLSPGTNSSVDSNTPGVVVQQPRQRGPAIAANGSQPAANGGDAATDTASPPLPPDTQSGANPNNTAAPTSVAPGGTPGNGAPSAGSGTQVAGPNGAPPDLKASILGTAAPGSAQTSRFGSTNGSASSQLGTLNNGGLAGVASKAIGHSIKTVNDQSNYSLWEFYYDPKKDTVPGGVQIGAYSQQNGTPGGQQPGPNAQSPGAFGSSSFGQSSGFGQGSNSGQNSSPGQGSGFGQSSFGNNSNSPNSSLGQSNGLGNTNQTPQTSNQPNPQ